MNFPYAVIEVKLQEDPPEWLQNLVRAEILLPGPKFSNYLHGTGILYQQYARNVPYWFLPDDENPRVLTPSTWEEMIGPSEEAVKDAAAWLFPSGFEPPSPESKSLWQWRGRRRSHSAEEKLEEGAAASNGSESDRSKSSLAKETQHQQQQGRAFREQQLSAVTLNSHRLVNGTTEMFSSAKQSKGKGGGKFDSGEDTSLLNGQPRGTPWRVYQSPPPPHHHGDLALAHSPHAMSHHPAPHDATSDDPGSGSDEVIIFSSDGDVSSARGVVSIHNGSTPSMPSGSGSGHDGSHTTGTGRSSPQGSVLGHGEDLEIGNAVTAAVPPYVVQNHLVGTVLPGTAEMQQQQLHSQHRQQEKDVDVRSNGAMAPIVAIEEGTFNFNATPAGAPTSNLTNGAATAAGDGDGDGDDGLPPHKRNSSLFPMFSLGSSRVSPRAPPPRAMVRTRVEPKTFFANERTFLQWLQISVLVMFLAMSLLK